MGRDLKRRVQGEPAALELLEEQIQGHDLGDRGGVPQGLLVLGVQHASGLRVDHHRGIGRAVAAALSAVMMAVMMVMPAPRLCGRRQGNDDRDRNRYGTRERRYAPATTQNTTRRHLTVPDFRPQRRRAPTPIGVAKAAQSPTVGRRGYGGVNAIGRKLGYCALQYFA